MVVTSLVGVLLIGSLIVIGLERLGFLPAGMRGEGLERVTVGLLWFIVATPLFIIWFTIGFVLMLIDVVIQIIFNREGIMPMNLHARAYDWYTANIDWLFYGDSEFDPLPYV